MGAESMKERMPWRQEFANDYPCKKDCPDRSMGCHAKCEKYIEAKEKNEAKKAAFRAKRDAEMEVNSYIARHVSDASGKPLKSR